MRNMFKLARNCLAGLALATTAYCASIEDNYVNDNHRQWKEGVSRADSLRKSNKKRISELEKKMFNVSYEESMSKNNSDKQNTSLPNYSRASFSDITNLFRTAAFYACRIPKLVFAINIGNSSPENLIFDVKRIVPSLMENSAYTQLFRKLTLSDEMDCKAYSTTAAASVLALKRDSKDSIPIRLVTGLFFNKKEASEGIGHQWAELLDGTKIDPSISIPVKDSSYVPISGVEMSVDEKKIINLVPRLFCLTPDIRD